jgi:hypothetical protein
VNIAIIRAFVRLRQMLVSHERLARKLEEMEMNYDERFRIVFEAIQELAVQPFFPRPRRRPRPLRPDPLFHPQGSSGRQVQLRDFCGFLEKKRI